MQRQVNQVAGIEDRLFAANMQSSSDKNGPKMKNWAGVWGIFCLGVTLWTHDHGEPWPAVATPFYTAIVAGHMAMEPTKGEPPMSDRVLPLNPH